MSIDLVSPTTHAALVRRGDVLSTGDEEFAVVESIPDLVRPQRRAAVDAFSSAYERVRSLEGRGSPDPAFYRSLPRVPAGTPFADQWAHRARSFTRLTAWLASTHREARLDVIDLGAGNAWLAARLAELGHSCLAVDVNVGPVDGLVASRHHGVEIGVARAEMTALPVADGCVDIAVACASAHYVDWTELTVEVARVLRPGGAFVVFDSPVYTVTASGERMVAEQNEHLAATVGEAATYDGPGFLTFGALAADCLDWTIELDATGPIDRVRRGVTRIRVGREPARLPFLVGTRPTTERNPS